MSNIEIIEIRIPGPMPPIVDNPDLSVEPTKLALRGNVEANFVARTSKRRFKTVALMLADTATTYAVVSEGDEFEASGFRYEVAAADASDHHLEMAGGVKLYVLKKNGYWPALAFGLFLGNWQTDAPGDIVDSTAAFQKLIDVMQPGDSARLPSGTIYLNNITIPFGKLSLAFSGKGNFIPRTVIQFLDGATGGFQLGQEDYSFENIRFRGVGNVTDANLFTSIRADNLVDQDWQFFNCTFENTYHVGTMLGRGLTVDNCVFGNIIWGDAFILTYPAAPVVGTDYTQTLEGGFRGFTVRNSRFHGFYQHLFNVTGNNAVNARGFTIVGNQCDSYARVIKGYGNDIVFTGNNWYCGWYSSDACLFDMIGFKGLTIVGNTISNSTNDRQGGDNPLVRATASFSGLTVGLNTFVRRDVPILKADVGLTDTVSDVVIANNTYVDCFVTAPYLVHLAGAATGGIQNIKIDETISVVPAAWVAVDAGGNWRNSSARIITGRSDTKQHSIASDYSRANEPRSGAYTGNGSSQTIFVGYVPKVVRIYKNDGTFVAARVINSLSTQPSTIVFTASGFTVSGTNNTSATVYYWEAA